MDQQSPKCPSTPSQETPPPIHPLRMNSPTPAGSSAKIVTPDRLMVPKAFKYPEMYKSPTDQIMSPVSKGLLARTKSKKSSGLLPPSSTRNQQHKIQASKFQDPAAIIT
ncbi:uncharacterized protein LOC112510368 [Cynara cardunculus var. scolymus]|uniref:Uncharacterized protein n=1 Tax=Cynara cardunculus var. scolymus TaxID=59895 RepID=A0A103YHF2_CYNCS|nr:uncharacterized protein LOC112510368 [Cynara cardunculus var. scolymus]KVI09130.1 hypothetical protein Ccrd_012539 [Cynara cardunculus var. scolymus]